MNEPDLTKYPKWLQDLLGEAALPADYLEAERQAKAEYETFKRWVAEVQRRGISVNEFRELYGDLEQLERDLDTPAE